VPLPKETWRFDDSDCCYYVYCVDCGTHTTDFRTEEEAVKVWNKAMNSIDNNRKKGHWIKVDDTKWRCSECDIIHIIYQYPHGVARYCPNCGTEMKDE